MFTGQSHRLPHPASLISGAMRELGRARWIESTLLTGFVLVALPFSERPWAVRQVLLVSLASALLFSSIYSLNSYFGFAADRLNPRLNERLQSAPARYLRWGGLSLLLSLTLFCTARAAVAILAALIFLLWLAYSVPGGGKSRPLLGTIIHGVAQVLHFHLGVFWVSGPSFRSLSISVFFALLFSGGHLIHELKDEFADRAAGIQTNAVVFGAEKIVPFYRGLTLLSSAYWAALFIGGLVSASAFLPFFFATCAHTALAMSSSVSSLRDPRGNASFQSRYRILYLLAGIAVLLKAF